eukprot:gene3209-3514_t
MSFNLRHLNYLVFYLTIFINLVRGEQWLKEDVEVRFFEKFTHLFQIHFMGELWFQSSDVFYFKSNQQYSTADGSTALLSRTESNGTDKLGTFLQHDLAFTSDGETVDMVGRIKQYSSFIIFEQSFPNGLNQTSTGNADGLSTGFPTFFLTDPQTPQQPAGYAHWISWFYDANPKMERNKRRLLVAPGFQTPVQGIWNRTTSLPGGIGGSGVTAVYPLNGPYNAILGAFGQPMAVSQVSSSPGQLSYGVMGNATHLPSSFSPQIQLSFSKKGITHGLLKFGQRMTRFYNKESRWRLRAKDLTLRFLGYTTDNGAYYYYHTLDNSTYETTLLTLYQYAQKAKLPFRYLLLDSWWYYKGSNGGVSNWTAMPDLFPRGLSYLTEATSYYIQAHNRYWALDNAYKATYSFIEDDVKQGAVPVDPQFWSDLLRVPKETWKLAVYEQDWLFNEFYQYVSQFLEDVQLGKLWLEQMNMAALDLQVNVQYCMPFIRHLLQSVEMNAVTQARASDDYVVSPYEGIDNWRIGGQSLLIYALGLWPSKDGFWSTSYQPGNPYGEDRFEPYPALQAAVTSLSAGPFAVGDGIGFVDRNLLLRASDEDGRLLFPSKSATTLDLVFQEKSRNPSTSFELWAAQTFLPVYYASSSSSESRESKHSLEELMEDHPMLREADDVITYTHLFAADIDRDDLKVTPSAVGYRGDGRDVYFVREHNNSLTGGTSEGIQLWSESRPLTLQRCDLADFQLYTVSPPLTKSVALLGEVDKWIAVSEQRFAAVYLSLFNNQNNSGENQVPHNATIALQLRGAPGETITVAFLEDGERVKKISCTFPSQHDVNSKHKPFSSKGYDELRDLEGGKADLPQAVHITMVYDLGRCL